MQRTDTQTPLPLQAFKNHRRAQPTLAAGTKRRSKRRAAVVADDDVDRAEAADPDGDEHKLCQSPQQQEAGDLLACYMDENCYPFV